MSSQSSARVPLKPEANTCDANMNAETSAPAEKPSTSVAAEATATAEEPAATSAEEPAEDSAPLTVAETAEVELANLGKRAQRRLARIQKQKERKVEKKEAAREAKKRKIEADPTCVEARRAAAAAAKDPVEAEASKLRNAERRAAAREEFRAAAAEGPAIVFDLSDEWELAMTMAERASLSQQIMYTYGFNKRCIRPARLGVTGLPVNGMVERHLRKHKSVDQWHAFELSHASLADHLPSLRANGDFLRSPPDAAAAASGAGGSAATGGAGAAAGAYSSSEGGGDAAVATEAAGDVIYLTADAEEELDEVRWDSKVTYVIGAIVDRNRMTRAARIRADALGIRPMRLPVAKFVAMDKTPVLTVNHCVELLARRGAGCEPWPEAFARTLPGRKDATIKSGAGAAAGASKSAEAGGGGGEAGAEDVEDGVEDGVEGGSQGTEGGLRVGSNHYEENRVAKKRRWKPDEITDPTYRRDQRFL